MPITSNLPFGRRVEVFADDVVAAALIERLVHHTEASLSTPSPTHETTSSPTTVAMGAEALCPSPVCASIHQRPHVACETSVDVRRDEVDTDAMAQMLRSPATVMNAPTESNDPVASSNPVAMNGENPPPRTAPNW